MWPTVYYTPVAALLFRPLCVTGQSINTSSHLYPAAAPSQGVRGSRGITAHEHLHLKKENNFFFLLLIFSLLFKQTKTIP